MPRRNRYKQLCEAYDSGVEECNQYRRECYEFVQDLRNAISESLNCAETKIFMFPPSTDFVFNGHSLQGDAHDTEFGENGSAAIGFAINVNDGDLEEKFFNFVVIFKKAGSKIVFSIDEEKEFANSNEGINDFCDYLFEVARKNLLGRLQNFLQSPLDQNTPIGFKLESEPIAEKLSKKL